MNAVNNNKNTPFIEAAYRDHIACVNLLLKRGADVNHFNRHGQTSLMATAVNGYDNVVAVLIKSGADVSKKDKK